MVDKTSMSADERVTHDLESAADAVFSGETIEGFEALATPTETPAAETDTGAAAATPEKTDDPLDDPATPIAKEETPTGDEKPAVAADVKPEEKKSGEEKLPVAIEEQEIPVDIKGKTRERMETLIGRVKETKTEVATLQEQLTGATEQLTAFKQMMDDTGLDDAQIVQMLDIGTMLKTDPEQAFTVLSGIVQTMAKDLGKTIAPVDLLEGFPDLQARVTKLELAPEDAAVIAGARRKEARDTRIAAQTRQQKDTAAHTTDTIQKGANEVKTFLMEAQKDVDYPKIAPLLVKAAKFAAENLDPGVWGRYIKDEHARIKEIAGMSRSSTAATGATPIVDKGAGGSKTRETKTLEDLADVLL